MKGDPIYPSSEDVHSFSVFSPTSNSGTYGDSVPKKSRGRPRCFTVSENKELESLLIGGKLDDLLSRETVDIRISTGSSDKLSTQQLSSWMNNYHTSKKKRELQTATRLES